MKEHSIRPMLGLSPAERAVKYLLDVLPLYPELSYYLCPGTNMFNLLCEAEAHRLGVAPDRDYELPATFTTRFAEEYAKQLKPKDPKEGFVCPECGHINQDTSEWVCRECGCTDYTACPEGCYWVEQNLCSRCAGMDEDV